MAAHAAIAALGAGPARARQTQLFAPKTFTAIDSYFAADHNQFDEQHAHLDLVQGCRFYVGYAVLVAAAGRDQQGLEAPRMTEFPALE